MKCAWCGSSFDSTIVSENVLSVCCSLFCSKAIRSGFNKPRELHQFVERYKLERTRNEPDLLPDQCSSLWEENCG